MLKKITAVFIIAVTVLSLAACSADTARLNKGAALTPTPFSDKVIDKDVAKKYEMKEIITYDGKAYKTFEYENMQVLARVEKSGNVRILFEYPLDTKITYDIEASNRSGSHIYFTKQDANAPYASLCAVYLPSSTQITIVDTPCSNMVLLDCPTTSDMYSYGIIADSSRIAVIDLKQATISSYSKTMEEISSFIDAGDTLFDTGDFGSYTETVIEAVDKNHVMVNIIQKNSKGETKEEINFTFNPSLGVATF